MNWDTGTHPTTQPGGHRPTNFIMRAPTTQSRTRMDGAGEGQELVVDTKPIPRPTLSAHLGSAALKSQDFIPSALSFKQAGALRQLSSPSWSYIHPHAQLLSQQDTYPSQGGEGGMSHIFPYWCTQWVKTQGRTQGVRPIFAFPIFLKKGKH